jgi:hypothetical protein
VVCTFTGPSSDKGGSCGADFFLLTFTGNKGGTLFARSKYLPRSVAGVHRHEYAIDILPCFTMCRAFGRFQFLAQLFELSLIENLADLWKHFTFFFFNVVLDTFN